MNALEYRKDIEGLRAIAILLVVAAHADLTWISGGFIGVDIFFVISGFLITRILVDEITNTGKINLLTFYARRLQRLLPTLILVILITGIALRFLLPHSLQPEQASAAAAAALWISNFHFALSETNYFGNQAETNAFLHTWSLGVEEQFYLFWPTLIIAAYVFHKSITTLKIFFIAIIFISFLACVYTSKQNSEIAFYMMPLRAWQFAAGALIFLFSNKMLLLQKQTIQGMTWTGISLIILSAIALKGNIAYPSFWAALPTLGTALMLAAGSATVQTIPGTLIKSRYMQIIGKVSYSWYLWHWPILTIGKATFPQIGLSEKLLLAILSLFIATATYYYFENPIRHWKVLASKPGWKIIAAFFIMVMANIFFIRWHTDAARNAEKLATHTYDVEADIPIIYGMGCDDWYHSSTVKTCQFGNKEAKNTAVIIGDSIGLQWFPALETIFNKPDWKLIVITKSACPIANVSIFYKRIGREYTECADWRNAALKKIAEITPDILFIGSGQEYDISPTEWETGSQYILSNVTNHVKSIFIIRATPMLSFNGPQCLAQANQLEALGGYLNCKSTADTEKNINIWSSIKKSTVGYPNVNFVDMNDIVCPDKVCSAKIDSTIVFRDAQHLTATFAKGIASHFDTAIKKYYEVDDIKK